MSRHPDVRRFNFVTAVVLMPHGEGGSFLATSVNLSESGMLLKADKGVEKGQRFEFMAGSFAGECRVMWSHATAARDSVFGIVFTSLGPTAKEEIGKLMAAVDPPVE